ncbi:MAG TPA: hypothetical protein VGV59_02650 [Pyrinomonadaceae bacterium]|nr:hypothetical protein [Pyrinomonadaceae bacterium]
MSETERLALSYFADNEQFVARKLNEQLAKIDAGVAIAPEVNALMHEVSRETSGAPGAGATIMRYLVTRHFYFLVNLSGSLAKAVTGSTGTATFSLRKNGTQFATMVFTSSNTAVFTMASPTSFVPGDEITIVAPNPADATLASLYFSLHARLPLRVTESVVWTSLVNASAYGSTLTKTSGASAFDAGAASTRAIQYGDSSAKFVIPSGSIALHGVFGLSKGNPGITPAEIDFGFAPFSGNININESGATPGGSPSSAIQANDEYEVAVEGTQVKYYRTRAGVRTLLWTSTVTLTSSNYPLLFDTAMYSPGIQIQSAVISGVLAEA